MPVTNHYKRLPLAQIKINRDKRQRSSIDTEADGLSASIARFGVLNPIIVTQDNVLVAGERRLAASAALNLPDIPVRYVNELNQTELQIIELDENLKRSDLPWRDQVRAVGTIHKLYLKLDSAWTMAETAANLGIVQGTVSMMLRVASDIDLPAIANAAHYREAFNTLSRRDERAMSDALTEIMEVGASIGTPQVPSSDGVVVPLHRITPAEESILNADFLQWVPAYSGPKFNFIHCDFPYGIEAFSGPQSGRDRQTIYGDSAQTYWSLVKCLCENLDRVMAHSGHLMFWFSMEHYYETLVAFANWAPSLEFQVFPLVWVKSDNVGILPDPKRGPRRIYETALIASREDRQIIKAVSNAYHAPTDKAHHPSTKPEPVLRHFFQMFIDGNSRVLDPTCGGGSALRAAESLGAERVLGLELDKEHCGAARSAIKQFRVLRSVTK